MFTILPAWLNCARRRVNGACGVKMNSVKCSLSHLFCFLFPVMVVMVILSSMLSWRTMIEFETLTASFFSTCVSSNVLPRDATHSAVLPWQVVRLSVCLYATLMYCGQGHTFSKNRYLVYDFIYGQSAVNFALSFPVSEILQFSCSELPLFSHLTPISPEIWGCFLWTRLIMLKARP